MSEITVMKISAHPRSWFVEFGCEIGGLLEVTRTGEYVRVIAVVPDDDQTDLVVEPVR